MDSRFQVPVTFVTQHSLLDTRYSFHRDPKSAGTQLQLCALRHRTQMYDHAILIAQHHSSHTAGQSKSSFRSNVVSPELRRVAQVINIPNGVGFTDSPI